MCLTTPSFESDCAMDYAGFPKACMDDDTNCGHYNNRENFCSR